uniref:Caspase-5-like n=1 Tax=Pundamilia nyererei TaxID=303518 RepID=A0A3B4HBR1_9CICH
MAGKLRKEFVSRVSQENLKELLEAFVTDGILNDLEKESILEENQSRADRVRCFIDTVKKKGDKACRIMFTHLQKIDSTLYSSLHVSTFPSAQKAQMTGERVKMYVFLQFTIFSKTGLGKQHYTVFLKSISKRVALLITNKTFNRYSTRHGAEKDDYKMHCMLAELGYDVVKYKNLTAKVIEEALQKFSKHPQLVHTDSVFVVIMSHGSLGAVCGTDCKPFKTENIYKLLNTENCPALHNKPKVIIIQACRGDEAGLVVLPDEDLAKANITQQNSSLFASGRNIETDAVVHKEKDFISLLSCTPNTVSYRDPSYGSFFIQYIVEVFNEFAHEDHIDELFRKVMQRFEESDFGGIQMPSKDRCTLTKNFYLLDY